VDHYSVLGRPPSATAADVKASYRWGGQAKLTLAVRLPSVQPGFLFQLAWVMSHLLVLA
jgi:hypothetical protein